LLLRDGCILLRNCWLDLSDRSFLFLALAGLFLYLAMLFDGFVANGVRLTLVVAGRSGANLCSSPEIMSKQTRTKLDAKMVGPFLQFFENFAP